MNAELIQPNIHIAVVHFPIALLALGVFLETFSFLGWRDSSLRRAARWMILFGAIAAAPVATSGIYALFDTRDATPTDALTQEIVSDHVLFGSIGTVAALLVCAGWIGLTDEWRRKLHWPLLVLMLLATAVVLSTAHHGGEMVYQHGIGVKTDGGLTEPASTQPLPGGLAGLSQRVAPIAPPLQVHMLLGGLAGGLGIIAIGVSSRAMLDRGAPIEPNERHDGTAIASAFAAPLADVVFAEERAQRAGPVVWLTILIGALASLAGWWFLAHDSDVWSIKALWQMATDRSLNEGRWLTRRTAHLIAGPAMLLLPLILLAISRYRPRGRVLWAVVSLLLLVAIAAQVWLGQLMLLDESRTMGPITRWSTR
ncbi:MAG TPA: DUF2231 domain-containing protein [Tepidisphaeraceae bacterium]|nr:DUF2231 domain-containing protein [Tepidisphaeraceae bacterium]